MCLRAALLAGETSALPGPVLSWASGEDIARHLRARGVVTSTTADDVSLGAAAAPSSSI